MKKIGEDGSQDLFILKKGDFPFVVKVNQESCEIKNYNDVNHFEQLLKREIFNGLETKESIISIAEKKF